MLGDWPEKFSGCNSAKVCVAGLFWVPSFALSKYTIKKYLDKVIGMKLPRGIRFSIILFLFFSTVRFAFADTPLNISVSNNNLYITSCFSQLQTFMGYKAYVDNTEVLSTHSGGGFPCDSGDLFFPNLSSFLSPYMSGPFHFIWNFYSSIDFVPPIYAHLNVYYNGTGFAPFDESTRIVSFNIATSTRTATVHDYIGANNVGSAISFTISTSTGNVYTASTVVSTTTGDLYYTFTYPELTSNGDYTFYTDINNGSVLTSTTTVITVAVPTPPAPTGNSSVLFLPGFEASRLYEERLTCVIDCEDQLWEPNWDTDVRALFMNADGTSMDTSVYTRDVLGKAYGIFNIYKSFLDKMQEMKTSGDIADYSAVPYDWRLSLNDILSSGKKDGSNISYFAATSSPYILQELHRLVAGSQNGKVTIVAHSNGGLLAKALLQKLADTNDPLLSKIDKLILVAVPQLGTPSALASLLHGYDQGIPASFLPLVLSDSVARTFGHNLPGAYNFLPSTDYFTSVSMPVVTFDAAMTDWIVHYGASVSSESGLNIFLADSFGRVTSDSSDTKTPTSLSSALIASAQTEHATLDNWSPPAGMQVIDIAGWGIPSTISGLKYSLHNGQIKLDPTFTIDGDGTVVTPSALYTNGNASTTRYWVNLKNYNSIANLITDVRWRTKHADILGVPQLLTFIEDIIEAISTNILPQYLSTSVPTPGVNDAHLIYSLHSPLTFNIYDDAGHHTGMSTTTGQIEEQVPGTYFIQIGDVKYIFTDTGAPVHVDMSGYDTGTFTFTIQQVQGDSTVSTVTFQDVPTNPNTQVSMTVGNDIHTLSNLNVDSDNNGTSDIILTPLVDSVVTYTSPVIPTPAAVWGGNVGPVANVVVPIATTSVKFASTTTVTSTIEKSQIQTSNDQLNLKNSTSQPTISEVPKVSLGQAKVMTRTKFSMPMKIGNETQTAQVISAHFSFGNVWQKTVNWFVSIFKRK